MCCFSQSRNRAHSRTQTHGVSVTLSQKHACVGSCVWQISNTHTPFYQCLSSILFSLRLCFLRVSTWTLYSLHAHSEKNPGGFGVFYVTFFIHSPPCWRCHSSIFHYQGEPGEPSRLGNANAGRLNWLFFRTQKTYLWYDSDWLFGCVLKLSVFV